MAGRARVRDEADERRLGSSLIPGAALHTTMEGGRSYGRELRERPRAVAQEALQPKQYRPEPLQQNEVDYIGQAASKSGFIASAAVGAMSAGAVYLANALSPRFRGALGVSGKAALIVTPTAGAFFLKSHLTIANARADPDSFVSSESASAAIKQAFSQTQLTPLQSMSNTVYVHPFKTIIGIAAPLYCGIFYRESTHPSTASMPLSQRLIHTRVYGQMIAVLSTNALCFCVSRLRATPACHACVPRLRAWHLGPRTALAAVVPGPPAHRPIVVLGPPPTVHDGTRSALPMAHHSDGERDGVRQGDGGRGWDLPRSEWPARAWRGLQCAP